MTCVWITRSEPGAGRLERALNEAGFQSVNAPVLTTEVVRGIAPSEEFDVTVFLSEHAVKYAIEGKWRSAAPVVAVGPTTGDALRSAGLQPVHPGQASSEGVFELFEQQYSDVQSVLIVAGAGGREDLAKWLKDKGVRVRTWITYRRILLRPFVDIGGCDAVVVSSAEVLSRIAELCFEYANIDEDQLSVLVPSDRVAEVAVSLGFRRIFNCDGADPQAVVATLIDQAL